METPSHTRARPVGRGLHGGHGECIGHLAGGRLSTHDVPTCPGSADRKQRRETGTRQAFLAIPRNVRQEQMPNAMSVKPARPRDGRPPSSRARRSRCDTATELAPSRAANRERPPAPKAARLSRRTSPGAAAASLIVVNSALIWISARWRTTCTIHAECFPLDQETRHLVIWGDASVSANQRAGRIARPRRPELAIHRATSRSWTVSNMNAIRRRSPRRRASVIATYSATLGR